MDYLANLQSRLDFFQFLDEAPATIVITFTSNFCVVRGGGQSVGWTLCLLPLQSREGVKQGRVTDNAVRDDFRQRDISESADPIPLKVQHYTW